MSRPIDLNVDIGEGFAFDRELLNFATSANVCCGAHAGDFEHTKETVALCREKRIRVGIHPGYPDRESMGRLPITPDTERTFLASIFEQVQRFPREYPPSYLKPHGGFYNDTAIVLPSNWEMGIKGNRYPSRYEAGGAYLAQYPGIQSLIMLLRVQKLPLLGLPGTAHAQAAGRAGQKFAREGFADRAYRADGTLVPRSEPNAIHTNSDQIREQVIQLAPNVDSICLHGDGDHCLEFAELVYRTLTDQGFEVRPWD